MYLRGTLRKPSERVGRGKGGVLGSGLGGVAAEVSTGSRQLTGANQQHGLNGCLALDNISNELVCLNLAAKVHH